MADPASVVGVRQKPVTQLGSLGGLETASNSRNLGGQASNKAKLSK